jgi:predicted Zn-dependent protease with MMP-like domain/Flp pilus assembly protein TadD
MLEKDPDAELERLVDEALEHLERGDASGALARAERAISRSPRAIAALHVRAAALADLGRREEARAAYEHGLRVGPDDLELLVDAAEFYLAEPLDDEEDPGWLKRACELASRGSRLARRTGDDRAASTFALLEARAFSAVGERREALSRIDAGLLARRDDLDLQAERGLILFELGRFEEARVQLREVLRNDAKDPWALHTLGLIAEREGDEREAERRFADARKLAPDEFPGPVELSPEAFDAAIEDALASLPDQVRAYLSNVAITVEDLPAEDDLLASEPPLSPSILGVFRGAPLGDKASMDPWNHFPSSIVLYQKNLQRFATNHDDLVHEIGVTLLHEVGHFLGLDEDELAERGLA